MRNTLMIGLAGVLLAILVSRLALLPTQQDASTVEPAAGPQTPGSSRDLTEQRPVEAPAVPAGRPERPLPRNDTSAAALDRQAAENGNAQGQIALGDRYLAGNGVPVDEAEALRWYSAAAAQGSAAGQLRLGQMYEHGRGTAKDLDAAHEWYTMAAEQGDLAALTNLGDQFEFGDYINYKMAASWYRRAANRGYVDAQSDLGRLYENGRGVDQDYRQAYLWYSLAAARGDGAAARSRDRVATKLNPAEIAEGQKLALEWRPRQPKQQPATAPQGN